MQTLTNLHQELLELVSTNNIEIEFNLWDRSNPKHWALSGTFNTSEEAWAEAEDDHVNYEVSQNQIKDIDTNIDNDRLIVTMHSGREYEYNVEPHEVDRIYKKD